jgi:hypothetical protein
MKKIWIWNQHPGSATLDTAGSTTNCLVIKILGAEAAWSGELAQLQLLHVCLFLLIVIFLLFLLLPGIATALLITQPKNK